MKFKIIAFFLLFSTYFINHSFAQSKPKRYDAIVRTENGRRFKGLLESVEDNGLTIFYHRRSKFISADSIKTIRIKKYNAQNRAFLIGGLLGVGSGLAIYVNQEDKGNVQPIILPVVIVSSTVAGAAIGGIINSFISRQKYENVNTEGRFKAIKEELKSYSVKK